MERLNRSGHLRADLDRRHGFDRAGGINRFDNVAAGNGGSDGSRPAVHMRGAVVRDAATNQNEDQCGDDKACFHITALR